MTKSSSSTSALLRWSVAITTASLLLSLVSCTSDDDLQDRLDDRNERYLGLQQRREMRQDARQERTDAWFDRVMH
jgi:hypothetical protein